MRQCGLFILTVQSRQSLSATMFQNVPPSAPTFVVLGGFLAFYMSGAIQELQFTNVLERVSKTKLCPPLRSESLDLSCTFRDIKVPCDQPMRPGTLVIEKCRYFYNAACEHEAYSLRCLDSGLWDYPLFYCTPDGLCKQDKGNIWTWKTISQCPKAQEGLRNGNISEACYFSNEDPYICCEPITGNTDNSVQSGPQPVVRKSTQMCKKYAETVFSSVSKTDSCALVEPIDAPVPEGSGYTSILQRPNNAQPREFPHTAVLGYGKKSHKRPRARCAGSLVSERYVIGTASCAETSLGPATWVRLGDYNINSNEDEIKADSRSEIYDIEERVIYPDYESYHGPNKIFYHDIALYKLSVSVKFNEYIRPICLHAGDQFAKTFALTTGWGPVEIGGRPSDILQKASVTIVEDEKCSTAYKFYGEVQDGLDTELVVCAALLNGRDPCSSIYGSPLQIRLRDPYCMYSLVGLAYLGRGCHVQSPRVYIRVFRYLDWIESIVWA